MTSVIETLGYNQHMKILILSPLFPPDVGAPAPYVKALMSRLKEHALTGLIYGYLPESVAGVPITAIDKRTWVVRRLVAYTKALVHARRDVDLIILNNAPSVELPMLLVSLCTKNTIVLCESDPLALKASSKGFYKLLHTLLIRQVKKVIILPVEAAYISPEQLPFKDVDTTVVSTQNNWWHNHLHELTTI
jgi:hypothetical protein